MRLPLTATLLASLPLLVNCSTHLVINEGATAARPATNSTSTNETTSTTSTSTTDTVFTEPLPASGVPPNGVYFDITGSNTTAASSPTDSGCGTSSPDPSGTSAPTSGSGADTVDSQCSAFSAMAVLSTQDAKAYLPSRSWSFLANVARVYTHVVLNGLAAGQHVLSFQFKDPYGAAYWSTTAVFTTGTSPQGVIQHADGWIVSVALPVAGTSIATSALYGTWRVEVSLDADPSPVLSVAFDVLAPSAG